MEYTEESHAFSDHVAVFGNKKMSGRLDLTCACPKKVHSNRNRDSRYFRVLQSTNFVLIRFIILYSSRLCLVISLILPDIWHGRTVIKPIEKCIFVCDVSPACVAWSTNGPLFCLIWLQQLRGVWNKRKPVETSLVSCGNHFFFFNQLLRYFFRIPISQYTCIDIQHKWISSSWHKWVQFVKLKISSATMKQNALFAVLFIHWVVIFCVGFLRQIYLL